MDLLPVLGLLLGGLAVIGGQFLEGGALSALVNGPAFLIVAGGTLGATLLQSPMPVFVKGIKQLPSVFFREELPSQVTIKKILHWSQITRREGLLGLEGMLDVEKDPFLSKGLLLLVDGNEPDVIRDILELDISIHEESDLLAARIFQAMGGYAPTIGIIGAVMGLIHVMYNLTDPSMLGVGIATAFVATIYGVGIANLVLLPIYNKLKNQVYVKTKYYEMIVDGIVAIADGENPRYIELKLRSYQHF